MAKIIERKATTLKAAGVKSVKPDFAKLGASLVEAYKTFKAVTGQAESAFISYVRDAAKPFAGITAEEYQEKIHPEVLSAFEAQGYSMPKVKAAEMKTLFLGFAHGATIPQDVASNYQKSVAAIRPQLAEKGITKAKKEREPAPAKKSTDNPHSAAIKAFSDLFGGDKGEKAWRRKILAAILDADKKGQLFDSHLADMAETLEIEE